LSSDRPETHASSTSSRFVQSSNPDQLTLHDTSSWIPFGVTHRTGGPSWIVDADGGDWHSAASWYRHYLLSWHACE
jgi:hypothetical protein